MTATSMTSLANRLTLPKRLFRASGNMAGVLRAQFEQTFAAQIERRSEECRREATAALMESERHTLPLVADSAGLEEKRLFGTDGRSRHERKSRASCSGPRATGRLRRPLFAGPGICCRTVNSTPVTGRAAGSSSAPVWNATGRDNSLRCEATTCTAKRLSPPRPLVRQICSWQSGAKPWP